MATMQKPKTKKKKKVIEESEYLFEDDGPILDFPISTTKCNEILSHDCFVSSEFKSLQDATYEKNDKEITDINKEETKINEKILNKQDSLEKEQNKIEEKLEISLEKEQNKIEEKLEISLEKEQNKIEEKLEISKNDEKQYQNLASTSSSSMNLQIPSAPCLEFSQQQALFAVNQLFQINYPDLAKIREEEAKVILYKNTPLAAINTQSNQQKPLTNAQLKELYECKEIEMAKQFEIEFLTNSLQDNYENDSLYCLLQQYSNLRYKLKMNLSDLQNIQNKIEKIEKELWTMETKSVQFSGTCADGTVVRGKESYDIAVLKENNLETVCSYLNELRNLLCFQYSTNIVCAETTKLKIEQIIREILSYPALKKFHKIKEVGLFKTLDPDVNICVAHLRRAVTILFIFMRKPPPDKEFSKDLKEWITQLLALHLRIATKEDHWFFLFHILRCPSGISQWAIQFLQIPLSNNNDILNFDVFDNFEINHCVSILKILLMPIKKRNEFLTAFSQIQSDTIKEDLWILVDSDGEDNSTLSNECPGLRENDLIALLNQIPFETLFRIILKITKKGDTYELLKDTINGNHLLKLIAFFSSLVEIFGEGLLTYNTEKYKQFTKRLGRLIRHTIQYLSDYHNLFVSNNLSKDPCLCERIKIEFDAFVIKSCSYIYRTRNLGTWQYFSSLPFENLDIKTCWHLFYCLNLGFSSEDIFGCTEYLQGDKFWKRFNVTVADISQEDMYYLLQTFAAIALERDKMYDWNFIQYICNHILYIGFINNSTKDTCYKNSRDILVNMCIKYPELISYILLDIKNHINDIESAIYLFKSLPLNQWKPDIQSFEILSSWLLNYSYDKNENILARIIISHLNWEFEDNSLNQNTIITTDDNNNQKLFLPYEIHVRMACLICEISNKHAPETIGYSGISESVRQVSSITDNLTTKEQFISWCWSIIATLRLHLIDQHRNYVQKILQNPVKYLNQIPELEKFQIIFQGVTELRPISIYTSILISLWGHSIPLICQKGFAQLKLLLNDYRHAVVIRCLYLIIPLFLECPEVLSRNDGFVEILKILLNADRTYIKMAKELITTNSPGPVLELLSNMIQSQIINYSFYGLPSPTILIELWLQVLTNIPNWSTLNVIHLIDLILKIAYQFPESWHTCEEFFANLFKNGEDPKTPKKMAAITIFLGSTNQVKALPSPSSLYPWLALLLLELEHEIYEKRTGLWTEFLRQLNDKDRKLSIDNALKKACSVVGYTNFQPQSLVLYKYANVISNMDYQHHLYPIMCQKFFTLYLTRIPYNEDERRFQHIHGVADKFYEYNISLMKRLKSVLQSVEKMYIEKSQEHAKTEDLAFFYTDCSRIMKSFLLWLEETTINNISINQNIELPPQFRAAKLKDIFDGNTNHWTELIYLPSIRKEQTDASCRWLKTCYRYNNTHHHYHKRQTTLILENKLKQCTINDSLDRIIKHLKSYDKPIDPPEIKKIQLLLDAIEKNKISASNLTELRAHLKILDKTARQFTFTLKELNSLSGNYRDLMQSLYVNMPYKTKRQLNCSSTFLSKTPYACTGPVEVTIDVQRPVKDEKIQMNINHNRERHDTIVGQLISQNVEEIVWAMRKIEHIVKHLILFQLEAKEHNYDSSNASDIGIQFFYDIIKNMNEDITTFPPTNELCTLLLTELGIFIRENQEIQGIKILETTLKRPELLKILCELFVPSKTNPEYFLSMYKFLIDSHMRRCDKKILFVLFSKFDLQNWLNNIHPKLSEINRLLQLIQNGLENWNQPETSLLQDLFRRHFTQIFEYEFPEHYGEILQITLNGISEQRLPPIVLLDLINSILLKCNCDILTLNSTLDSIQQESIKFATQQNLFNFKEITDTILLFARHFQNERLQHGLHGLYPKHKNYCIPLTIWFSCFGHASVASAIFSYPGVLSDQICDWIFAPIVDMYSPWLVTYTGQNLMQQTTANWIKQLLSNGKVLHPWSELNIETAQTVIFSFVNCLQYILDSLPVSNSILGHIFGWYDYHFAKSYVSTYVRTPIHSALISLPWNRFQPLPIHIDIFCKILKEYLPECHSFLGFIFIRIQWTNWINEMFTIWNLQTQTRIISQILNIFIQISFEPHLHDDVNMSKILQESLNYPWHLIEYQSIESMFNWLILTVDPVIIIKLPSECNSVDLAVLELLKQSSDMLPTSRDFSSLIQSKRILYVQSIVRLLRTCATKHQKLLDTKDGLIAYQNAIIELIEDIEQIGNSIASINESIISDRRDIEKEILNMISEIICSLTSQSEFTSKLFVDAIIMWQSKCNIGSRVINTTLNAFGLCKSFIFSMYSLLEATIHNYFRYSEGTKNIHSPSWTSVMQRLGHLWNSIDLMTLLKGPYLLSLHGFIMYKMQNTEDIGEKITFLEDLSQLLEPIKTNEMTESKIAIIWGSMIIYGCKILQTEINAKKSLLMLARYLQTISTQSEGWSEGLLGVIGLKKDNITNKRKILTRCLSCLIFSLFPDKSTNEKIPNQEFLQSLEELKNVSISKKYNDIKLLSTRAITIIEDNYFPDLQDEFLLKVCNIISLLYDDYFVIMACEIWKNNNNKCP